MSEWTLHTGLDGSEQTIHIDWFNENNVHRTDTLCIRILPRDKPRTLVIELNDVEVARVVGSDWQVRRG
jgi:hypothetical protein